MLITALFGSLAIASTGFAAWIITGDDSTSATGNVVVETAEDIIERVKTFMHYDLIISNNEYYGSKHKSKITSSFKLLDELKEIVDFDTPVIVLTVSNDRDKFISYGFSEHIEKVIDEEKIVKTFPKVIKKIKFETIEKQ